MKATIECPKCGIKWDVELELGSLDEWQVEERCPNCKFLTWVTVK